MNAIVKSVLILALGTAGCLDPIAAGGNGQGLDLPEADLRVVFLGNSLTYVNDVPGLVQAMADADGRSMAHVTIAAPNYSLEDHWNAGVSAALRELGADVVVLQQGPSSLPDNQEHLRHWAGALAAVIREAGGAPALYMVWPSAARMPAFPDVWDSYLGAAEAVDGPFIPAGQTWVEAWELDPGLELYGLDGFHQNPTGALAAAMTIYAVLFDVPADSIPSLDLGLADGTLATLRAAVAESRRLADLATGVAPRP